MRLRRIESSKATTATSSTTTSATITATAAETTCPTAGTTEPTTTHHSAKTSRHAIPHVPYRPALPLRLRHHILNPLPNIILAIPRQPIRLTHLPIHGHGIVRRRIPTQAAECRHLRSHIPPPRTRIGQVAAISSGHTQCLQPPSRRCSARSCHRDLLRLLLLHPRSQLHTELRHLLRLAPIRSRGVDQNLFGLRCKRRQLRPHHIPAISRHHHGKRTTHICRRRILLTCQRISRSHPHARQWHSSRLHRPG